MKQTHVTLAHGSGGSQMAALIRDIFTSRFTNPVLERMCDSAIVEIPRSHIAYTTDSYVVRPIFFPGGDIGKLAVCGTVNDLAVAGAKPLYLTSSFIIEEGFPIEDLEKIAASMAAAARESQALIVAGDTKVVEKGGCDGIFITTSGVGELFVSQPMIPSRISAGDAILVNGPIADHGMAVMTKREGLKIESEIKSDCAPLASLAAHLASAVPGIKFMRDATRGGLGAVLCEAADGAAFGIELDEEVIPLREGTLAACELLGIDPLYVANEGKLVAVVPQEDAAVALASMQSHPLGKEASLIGRATAENPGKVLLKTSIGSQRIVAMPSGDQLPRIC